MTRGLNKIMIIGGLGRDAEMRYTPTGRPITSFSVVVEREEAPTERAVDWVTIVAWDSLAETCNEQLGRGKLVYVEGRLQTRGFQKGGQKHYRSEVVAEVVIPLEDTSPPTDEDQEEELPVAADETPEESVTEGEEMETSSPAESQDEPMEAEVVIPLEDTSPPTDEDQEEELPVAADETPEESVTEGEEMETSSPAESQDEPVEDEEADVPSEESLTKTEEDSTDSSM